MSTARDVQRWWAEINAKGISSVLYPTLWLTPFLSVILVGRSVAAKFHLTEYVSYPMAIVIELLGVTTGHNLIESRGRQRVTASALFAGYVATVAGFILIADGYEGLVFPALSVVAILTANIQLQRQVRRDDAKAAKERANVERVTTKDLAKLAPKERVAQWKAANVGGTQERAAKELGMARSTVGYYWRQLGTK